MMSAFEWVAWYRSQPFSSKWFILLLLFRPFLDNFYFLKNVSPLLSPLYIIGVLTPVLIFFSFLSPSFKPKFRAPIADFTFGMWGALVLVNSLIVLFSHYSMSILGNFIKFTTPVFLFFYARHVITSKKDLHGVLQAFLLGCIFPGITLAYEQIFGAISPEHLTESRGGGTRIQGAYADIMNYAIYVVGSFLVITYFFLRKVQLRIEQKRDYIWLIAVLSANVAGLVSIKQVSTFVVFAAMAALFLVFLMGNRKSVSLLLILLPLALFVGKKVYDRNVKQLVDKEIRVIEGDSEVDRSFNGRMWRWRRYFELWSEMPDYTLIVGVPSSGFKEVPSMVGGGMHSEYVRILFLTGFGGLLLFLLFVLILLIKVRWMTSYDRYLVLCMLAAFLLHSVSTTPFLYASYSYLLAIIFSFALLPVKILYEEA